MTQNDIVEREVEAVTDAQNSETAVQRAYKAGYEAGKEAQRQEVREKIEDVQFTIASETADLCENSDHFKSLVMTELRKLEALLTPTTPKNTEV